MLFAIWGYLLSGQVRTVLTVGLSSRMELSDALCRARGTTGKPAGPSGRGAGEAATGCLMLRLEIKAVYGILSPRNWGS